jgi:pilus assembly protein CpaF
MTTLSSAGGVSRLTSQDLVRLKKFLIDNVSRAIEAEGISAEHRDDFIRQQIEAVYDQANLKLPQDVRGMILKEISDELLGYGPLQPLLRDPDVTEVMVNGPKSVYVEKKGQLQKSQVVFDDDNHVLQIIDRIILPLGRRVDADSPTVDARLPDGSRVNAVIPPVAIDGPSITIRKFSKEKLGINNLIDFGSITEKMAEFLRACVLSHLNIIISGGTGSGKTTLLNVLSSYIPDGERIVTIEDAAELQLQQDHVLRMETKPANVDGRGAVTIRDLVRNSLRMRPDRIVVGEVRANSPRDAIARLETLVLMAGMDLPLKVVRQQIASAVDLIVQQTRLKDGSRKVTAITEVAGMEGDTVVLTDVFKFEQTGVSTEGKVLGDLKPTGIRPLFSQRLEAAGFKLGADVFGANIAEMLGKGKRR